MKRILTVIALTNLIFAAAAIAQRQPVLKQVDLPHSYYWREMYIPQLTTGPSSVSWSPDSNSLVYSMGGSLWQQQLDSTVAEQLTAGPGYDYQPDWSPDGRWIVYASYFKDAIELYALDVQTRQSRPLTSGGNVNVEPRWSPDGAVIAFVSTAYNHRFHIFVGDFKNGALVNVERLTGESRTSLPRYYYSEFDHEISPTWSPDSEELIFVSNRGHIYGTGGFWRMKAVPGAEAHEIYYEETTWKARPDWSPDGKSLIYSSYLGRAWNQIWTIPAQGGDAFPLSYGEFDNTAPRWSRDGKHIAFISNRGGNTSLWVEDVPGGVQREVAITERRYLKPMGKVSITVLDSSGRPTPARVSVLGGDGRAYAPDDAWMHADDGFDRAQRAFEAHYFHSGGESELTVPAGQVSVQVIKGFEHKIDKREIQVAANQQEKVTIQLQPLAIPKQADVRWASADLHVHMNYAGSYRNTPKHLVQQGEAENLALIENLVVNKEQRIPDISYFRTDADPATSSNLLLMHSQEFHTSYWGHLGVLNLMRNFLLPDYSAYPNTAADSLVPMNGDVADLAHSQGATVGYVHPFETFPDPSKPEPVTDELPVDVALGKVDYIEVLGFSDHKSTAAVWYRLLNCGFRLPTGAGTDAMANFASLHGPVGLDRVYAQVPEGPLRANQWLESLRHGHTFATNGPLLGFKLGDRQLGDELKLDSPQQQVKFTAWMRSIIPVDHLQIICNGEVVRELPLGLQRDTFNTQGALPMTKSGWCLLRAWNEKSADAVLDAYPYATTSPIYVTVANTPVKSAGDAAYFIAWIDRIKGAVENYPDWNTPAEKTSVMKQLSDARAIYAAQLK